MSERGPTEPGAENAAGTVDVGGLRGRIGRALGVERGTRERIVEGMIRRPVGDGAGYWLQLVLATGIASLGLALNSTGVVIGAMLVSPLMAPIVETGMGLAVGSIYLAVRAAIRVSFSILVVVVGAAVLTWLLPFHEITTEIHGRTAPTLIDLGVAMFCAFAAGYTTLRTDGTAGVAAGTAISIALVPPLAVVGFGVATARWSVAYGAALLFTANLSAIVAGTAGLFILIGFDRVGASALETRLPESTTVTTRLDALMRRLGRGARGPVVRLLLPMLFVGAVLVPLRRALHEVAWQIGTRAAASDIVRAAAAGQSTVRTAITIEGHEVSVLVILVGRSDQASRIRRTILTHLRRATGLSPTVKVIAVPAASTVDELEAARAEPNDARPEPPRSDTDSMRDQLAEALQARWPNDTAGRLLAWSLSIDSRSERRIQVVHLGPALGPSGVALLSAAVSGDLGLTAPLALEDQPVDERPHPLAEASQDVWLRSLDRAVDLVGRSSELWLCVDRVSLPVATPPRDARRPAPSDDAAADSLGTEGTLAAAVARALSLAPGSHVQIMDEPSWGFRMSATPCAHRASDPPLADAAVRTVDAAIR